MYRFFIASLKSLLTIGSLSDSIINLGILFIKLSVELILNLSITIAYRFINCFLLKGRLGKKACNNSELLAAGTISSFNFLSPNFTIKISGKLGKILAVLLFSLRMMSLGGKVFPKTTFSILFGIVFTRY